MSIGSCAISRAAVASTPSPLMRTQLRVSLIIPARNEARNLAHILPYIPPIVDEVILVDGHSTDDTIAVAKRLLPGIIVLRQLGKGKGDALRYGFAMSTGDIFVMMDADGSTDPGEIPRYVEALLNGADFAKGSRFAPSGGSADITAFRKLGNFGLSLLVNTFFRTKYSDLCYGFNAFMRDCLECITIDCDGFEVETLLSLRAQKARLTIAEVPSYEHTRIHGASNLQAIRDGLRVVRTIFGEWIKGSSTVTDARCIPSIALRRMTFEAAQRSEAHMRRGGEPGASGGYPLAIAGPLDGPAAIPCRTGADVAVVIAAYADQRWPDLIAAVESVRAQTMKPNEIVVVVDHNEALLERVRARWDDVTVLPNTAPCGLSGARNTGIARSSGELIAFLDDDAVAESEWLERLVAACDSPLVLGSGGWIEPMWRDGRPRWFPNEFGWVVGCSYEGLPHGVAPVRNVIGSSMCIRRAVFAAVGGFRYDVGRIGAKATGCEETELCVRALQRWPQAIFMLEPQALIHHAVTRGRGRWRYFLSRCYYEGRSKASVVRLVGKGAGLSTERAYTLRVLPLGVLRGIGDTLAHLDPSGLARACAIIAGLAATTTGYLLGRVIRTNAMKPQKAHEDVAPALVTKQLQRLSMHASSPLWNVRADHVN